MTRVVDAKVARILVAFIRFSFASILSLIHTYIMICETGEENNLFRGFSLSIHCIICHAT